MTTYYFGSSTNDYVEVPDPTYVGAGALAGSTLLVRPPAGTSFLVRDTETHLFPTEVTDPTGTPLTTDAMVCLAFGYLAFRTSAPIVEVSADLGATWKTLYGQEALGLAVAAGLTPGGGTGTVVEVAGVAPDIDGNVPLTKADLGLDQVDNTADANKPLSSAATTALAGKQKIIPQFADQAAAIAAIGTFTAGDLIIVVDPT